MGIFSLAKKGFDNLTLTGQIGKRGVNGKDQYGLENPWEKPQDLGPYQSSLAGTQKLYRDPSQGDSPWLAMGEQKLAGDNQGLMDQAANKSASDAATARDNLAMNGGLSSGAAERSGGDPSMMWQQLAAQNESNKLGLGIQDEAWNRDNQRLDLTNQINDNAGRNAYNLDNYNTKMTAWASGQQAKADSKTSKGGLLGNGGLLGTGLFK